MSQKFTTPEQSLARLERLVQVMRRVRERDRREDESHSHFFWGTWASTEHLSDEARRQFSELGWRVTPENITPEIMCGTQACVLGWAALDGEFRREGLTFELASARMEIRWDNPAWIAYLDRMYDADPDDDDWDEDFNADERSSNEGHGAAFFGLDSEEESWVFFGPGGAGTEEAIRKIEEVIARRRAELGLALPGDPT